MKVTDLISRYTDENLSYVYDDLVTIITISVLFFILSIPVFTIGSSMIAAHKVINDVHDGRRISEMGRMKVMIRTFSQNLLRGLPISILLLLLFFMELMYIQITLVTGSSTFLVLSVVGLYIIILTLPALIRSSNIMSQSGSSTFIGSVLHSLLTITSDKKGYVKHVGKMSLIVAICSLIPILGVILLPGILSVMEVKSYETVVTNRDVASPKKSMTQHEI
ncbi:hypothetical protein [Halalkalicoccus tibetensis]|uniref:DUF624 domain-containing protein n=1 Tax=Halalkalicoccus tibetensis TaxID=175632 RepID=A0ABD5VDG1_9EURY